jgi:hypothetical protein
MMKALVFYGAYDVRLEERPSMVANRKPLYEKVTN